jgi:hypothetical protein
MAAKMVLNQVIQFQLDGQRYSLSKEDVCNKVAFAVPKSTDKYFVLINQRPYPPKQVLELALGVPSRNFTTAAANAILRRLGFEINTASSSGALQIRTESERLFETYLQASGYLEFEFEPSLPGSNARPDFILRTNREDCPTGVLFEVKEFQPMPADFQRSGGSYDPYGAIREKIQEGRKKFRDFKQYPCALVLYNAGKPLVDLRWELIYGAMLGNLGWSIPFDKEAGKLVDKAVLAPAFMQGGEMHREKNGVAIEPQNTTISAIVVLQLLAVGNSRFQIEVKTQEQQLGRSLKYEEFFRLVDLSGGTERDISLHQLRTVTCLNPYKRVPFPQELFRGPYDECFGDIEGELQRIYAGPQLKRLEFSQAKAGIRQGGFLQKEASR